MYSANPHASTTYCAKIYNDDKNTKRVAQGFSIIFFFIDPRSTHSSIIYRNKLLILVFPKIIFL